MTKKDSFLDFNYLNFRKEDEKKNDWFNAGKFLNQSSLKLPNQEFSIPVYEREETTYEEIIREFNDNKRKEEERKWREEMLDLKIIKPLIPEISHSYQTNAINLDNYYNKISSLPSAQISPPNLVSSSQNSGIHRTASSTSQTNQQRSRIEMLVNRQRNLEKRENPATPKPIPKIDLSKINIDLPGLPELSDTILASFSSNGDIFVYSHNKFYTLRPNIGEKGYFLTYKGKEFRLEESESLFKVERDFLARNKENIRRFQEKSLEELSKENGNLIKKFSELKQALNNRFSVEEFISDYIFNLYHGKKTQQNKRYEDIELPKEDLIERVQIQEIGFDGQKNSVLDYLIRDLEKCDRGKYGDFVFVCGNVYGFASLRSLSKLSRKKSISLDSSTFIGSIENFNNNYKRVIAEEVKKKVKRGFSAAILEIAEKSEELDKLRETKRVVKNREGDIGFVKKNENEYLIYRDLPQFIIKKSGNHYLFPEVRIGTRIILGGEDVSFNLKGGIETPHYRHPFVFSGGGICFGPSSGQEKEILGIDRAKYNINKLDKKKFAVGVLKVLDFTESVLTKGYSKTTHPVSELSYFSSMSSDQARNLRGIKIYDNDRSTI